MQTPWVEADLSQRRPQWGGVIGASMKTIDGRGGEGADRVRVPTSAKQTRRRIGRPTLALALLLTSAIASAQSPSTPPPTELSLEALLGVEVESVFGASKSLQKITEAPAAVTIVTAQEIERYGWRTLADVLRSVRGFYVTDDRAYAYVGSRGFGRPGDYSTRVLITVDGHRFNDNVYDQALIEEGFQLDLAAVDRIEIVRGPSSSLYGSNAFFGVINVLSKSAAQGRTAQASMDVGTLGLRSGRFLLRHTFPGGLGLAVSGGQQRTTGLRTLYFPEFDSPQTNFGMADGRDGSERTNLFARADYGAWSLKTGFNVRTKHMPTAAYASLFNEPSFVSDTHALVDLSWERTVGWGWNGVFRGAADVYGFSGSYPYDWDENPMTPARDYLDRAAGRWSTVEARLSRTFARRHQVSVGVEHRMNLRQDQFSYLDAPYEPQWSDRRRSSTTGLYVQDQFQLHRTVIVNVGARLDHYSEFSDPFKPRVALVLQPRERTTVKLIYGSAFRAPNVFESYYITPGQWKERPGLQAEEMRTLEAVAEHYAGKRIRVAAGLFRYAVDGLIDFTTDPDDGLHQFANVGQARATGLELEAEAKWPSGLQARVGYTLANTKGADGRARLTNSPRHVTQALLSIPFGGGSFVSFDVQHISQRTSRTGSTVPAYLRPNVTVTGPLLTRRLRLVGTLSNFTNALVADPVGDDFLQDTVPQNGRTGRLSMTWQF